ncbi:MAG TPA: serine/threonine-protein kinase [Labilithrix sp.]|nr:serine/threonine-protein kinase [Labilithrix sp.]
MDAPVRRILAEKYELLGLLGEGGTGVVYDAVRTSDNEPVALKVMHGALAGDRQIRGRFQREAAILRRLSGDHVCPILELGEVPGDEGTSLLYIALRKIAGESLADVLARGLLPVDRALDVMLQVLEALTSAHAQGIIHRDLKPANVLLEGGTKAVVVDFGMSKIVTGGGMGTTNLTAHNMVFGTPEYMSPEQARGDELDARCDVYAAGIMLYEMLTGEPPFTGATPLSILTAHLTSDLDPPSKRPNGAGRVTPALETVVVNALARDRDERYASAAAFAAAIEHARTAPDKLTSLRPPSASKVPDVFASTFPATVGENAPVDATAPTLISDGPPFASTPPRASTKPSSPPSPESLAPRSSEPSTSTWVIVWVVVGLASIAIGVYFALRP